MGTHLSDIPRGRLSPAWWLATAIVAQVLFIPPLWRHASTGGAILGRYSPRYAAVLALSVALLLGWLTLFLARHRAVPRLHRLPLPVRAGLIAAFTAAAGAAFVLPMAEIARDLLATNAALAALALILLVPDGLAQPCRWPSLLLGACGVVLAFLFVAVLADRRFSPDEANWADMATSPFVAEGLYSRTWLQEPLPIIPGLGWSPAAYGWVLRHVAFDVMTGRAWNFAFYVLAFVGVYAVTARLYHHRAAAVSTAFAALGQSFVPVLDYRPDHQLPAAGMLIAFTALQARHVTGPRARLALHAAAGLFAALAMELHAGAVVYIAAFGLFYVGEVALRAIRTRRLHRTDVAPLVAFVLGGLLGGAVYYAFNIHPVGGVQAYLDHLVENRGERFMKNAYLVWRSLFDRTLAWGALVYLLWRRRPADVTFLSLFALIVLADMVLDRPGYPSLFSAFYAVPVGVLVMDGFRAAALPPGHNRRAMLAAAAVAVPLVAQMAATFPPATVARVLREGRFPPYLYVELGRRLEPLVEEDTVVVSTELLIWGLPDHRHLISTAAEHTASERWGIPERAVWERVAPDLVVLVDQETVVGPGLRAYINEQSFGLCDTFMLHGLRVDLLAPSCPTG